jgi:hypothetical protein
MRHRKSVHPYPCHDVNHEDEDSCKQRQRARYLRIISLIAISCILAVYVIYSMIGLVYPELMMAFHSTCRNPYRSWRFRWSSSSYCFDRSRPKCIHILDIDWLITCMRGFHLMTPLQTPELIRQSAEQPIVMIGTHHKAGTYISRKILGVVCQHMNWCCMLHPSKDTKYTLMSSLSNEDSIRMIEHAQWIWLPEEIADRRAYRFIHIHRKPFDRLISGLEYHSSGIESWTRKALFYQHACHYQELLYINTATQNSAQYDELITNYCKFSHICEACCVYEHQQKFLSKNQYETLCKYASRVKPSLMESLSTESINVSLAIQASLDYFENLRAAKILSHTKNDAQTLNIDLDDFDRDYDSTMDRILIHIGLSDIDRRLLLSILRRYDVRSNRGSSIYKHTMQSKYFRHISSRSSSFPRHLVHDMYMNNEDIRQVSLLFSEDCLK